MLQLKNVDVSYGKSKVIHNVTLSASQGEKIYLMGMNGVGKTTLLKNIMGILNTERGNITFNNSDITNLKTYQRSRAGISYVPQGREIIPTITVRENLEIGGIVHHQKKSNQMTKEVLDYFPDLNKHLNRKGGLLSGGQQQQLAIARALMSDPKVLLLDEPSEGIQPNIVEKIANTLNYINKEKDIIIFLVEQNLDFSMKVASKYFIMEKGSIIKDGNLQKENIENIKQYLTI